MWRSQDGSIRILFDRQGELCTLDHNDLPNILHSSFHTFVEQYALLNEISDWDFNPYFFDVKSPDSIEAAMGNYDVIPECCDEYNTWWSNGNVMAQTGVWLDRPEYYFRSFGLEKIACDELIRHLQHQGILA